MQEFLTIKVLIKLEILTTFESVVASSSPFNSPFADENFSANGRFQRQFGKIRASLSSGINFSKFNQYISDINNPSISENFLKTMEQLLEHRLEKHQMSS